MPLLLEWFYYKNKWKYMYVPAEEVEKADKADLKLLEGRFDGLEARFVVLESKFDVLDSKVSKMDAKLSALDLKSEVLEKKVDRILDKLGA